MFNKLKQFKELRSQAKTLQTALKEETVTCEKGGVTITMDGNQDITAVLVRPDLLSLGRKRDLENAIRDANAAAIEKTKRIMARKMQSMGGFDQFGLGDKKIGT
ncbi:MAG: YbaB/EbfC family nucleoid-associated protein [Parcubacteria group bacterium]|nr:YbaB/EbfC family nucleoid-associated protein [Parcubacteria group bacterium]